MIIIFIKKLIISHGCYDTELLSSSIVKRCDRTIADFADIIKSQLILQIYDQSWQNRMFVDLINQPILDRSMNDTGHSRLSRE